MDDPTSLPCSAVNPLAKILCVDDEPNILSSLRRLFRGQGYQVLTAESGNAALQVLESETVDIVISDMRMPQMDGARFLECVRAHWPDTIRLLLTGYADIELIIEAINRGEIYRYINKPWDENDILLVVRHALERKGLEREKARLEALTRVQNEELKVLNSTLENRVASRTAELRNLHDQLIRANEKLKTNYLTSIKVFSSIIEMRGKNLVGHSRRVADLARKISVRMALGTHETQSVFIAGLLHNIGKIGFSDDLLAMPVSMMNGEHLGAYQKYPVRGEQLLTPLEDLRDTAKIIRAHQERFDGEGFPDGLSGFDIPIGARILAVATDYDNLQIGVLSRRQCRPEQAAAIIIENRGKRYDESVIEAFQEVTIGRASAEILHDQPITVSALRPGMVTSRDLVTKDGSLLLSADHMMNERLIQQIVDYEKKSGLSLTLYIRSGK